MRPILISTASIFTFIFTGIIASADPQDLDTFTPFVGSSVEGVPFSIGATPERATFSGNAFKGTVGVTELYRSGLVAWMVNPGGVGVIDFETPASIVGFFARTRSNANGATVINALGANDFVIDTFTLDIASFGSPFVSVSFTGEIHKLEVQNLATGNGQMNSLEDFGYSVVVVTPVPEPSTALLTLLACASLAMRRRVSYVNEMQ